MLLRVGLLLLLLRCAALRRSARSRARPAPAASSNGLPAPSSPSERIVVRECFADEICSSPTGSLREEAAAEAADLMARGAVALGGGGGGDDDVALFSRVMPDS